MTSSQTNTITYLQQERHGDSMPSIHHIRKLPSNSTMGGNMEDNKIID